MEIRAVREQELEAMIELQCLIFRPDGHERYTAYLHGDPSYELGQTRVVVVDGEIVATLRIWDRTIRVGATAVKMGGIGGVGTHPAHRRRGYASAMLRDASDWMRSRGYLTSVLFTEVASQFYRRHGWASVPMPGFRIGRPGGGATIPAPGGAQGEWRVEAFDEARDLGAAMALYERYNAGLSGALVRDRPYWDSEPARIRGILPTVGRPRRPVETCAATSTTEIEEGQAEVCELAVDDYRGLGDRCPGAAFPAGVRRAGGRRDRRGAAAPAPPGRPALRILRRGSRADRKRRDHVEDA